MKLTFKLTVRGKQVWAGNDIAVASRRFYERCSGKTWKDTENLVRLMRYKPEIDDYETSAFGDAC